MRTFPPFISTSAFCAAVFLFCSLTAFSQTSPYRGLWVGTAGLRAVNQVTTSFDGSNPPIAVAEDPNVPTPTFDRADLRIILHVNGAGQVSLLKDVAIVNRNESSGSNSVRYLIGNESDVSLVTNPDLYVDYPPQPAMRIASAVFDFGDSKPTEVLDEVVETAANAAAIFVMGLPTLGQPLTAQSLTEAAITSNIVEVVVNADVSDGFTAFLDLFDDVALSDIAADTNAAVVAVLRGEAEDLRDRSSYMDKRAVEMLEAVLDAVAAADPTNTLTAAVNVASSYADIDNLYQRFISGSDFGQLISAGAEEAGIAAKLSGATSASIRAAMVVVPEVNAALTNALQVKVQRYDDTRTELAKNAVLDAMAETAFVNAALPSSDIQQATEAVGRGVLADMVARYPVPLTIPTLDYVAFVQGSDFMDLPATVASAAAQGAVEERDSNPLFTTNSVYGAAKLAVMNALRNEYLDAARAGRTELPLVGSFGPGLGDPRPVSELTQPSDLGPAALEGRIFLPESHPTNPFRHRRHPDHTVGFDIERIVRFDFDGVTGDSLEPAGFGVDRITGMYREEIFGLHKALGQDPLEPIGLKTEGRFDLQRISFIDTLNTR